MNGDRKPLFKPGDVVTINIPENKFPYYCSSDMLENYHGRKAIIRGSSEAFSDQIHNDKYKHLHDGFCYFLLDNEWCWSSAMFKEVQDEI